MYNFNNRKNSKFGVFVVLILVLAMVATTVISAFL